MANKPQAKLKMYKGYGENIKRLRIEAGLTLQELSKKIAISDKSISLIETETRPPTIDQINAYSEFFNIPVDYLTGRMKAKSPDIQMICEYTGLSEKSVIALREFNDNFKNPENNGIINYIDSIFSSPDFYQILLNCNNIDVCSKEIPTFSDYEIIEISKKLKIDVSFLHTKIYNGGFERGRQHPNIFKYDNIACMNRINDIFDNSPDISSYTKEDLTKLFDISDDELVEYSVK
jgi:Helix-turn-helix.